MATTAGSFGFKMSDRKGSVPPNKKLNSLLGENRELYVKLDKLQNKVALGTLQLTKTETA